MKPRRWKYKPPTKPVIRWVGHEKNNEVVDVEGVEYEVLGNFFEALGCTIYTCVRCKRGQWTVTKTIKAHNREVELIRYRRGLCPPCWDELKKKKMVW